MSYSLPRSLMTIICCGLIFFTILFFVGDYRNDYYSRSSLVFFIFLFVAVPFALSEKKEIRLNLFEVSGLVFFIYLFFSGFCGNALYDAINNILLFPILYFLFRSNLNSGNFKKITCFTYVAIYIWQMLIASLQIDFRNYLSPNTVIGSFGNSGIFANFSVILLPFVYQFLSKLIDEYFNHFKALLLKLFIVIYCSFIIISTGARTAWISLILLFFLFIAFKLRHKSTWIRSKRVALISILSVFIFLLSVSFLREFKSESRSGRELIYLVTFQIIKDNAWFGVGHSSFASEYNKYQAKYFAGHSHDKYEQVARNNFIAFNDYFQFLSENGVVGTAFLIICLSIFINLFWKHDNNFAYYGIVGSLISFFICALFSYPLLIVPVKIFLVFSFAYLGTNINSKHIFCFNLKKRLKWLCLFILFIAGYQVFYFLHLYQWKKLSDDMTKNPATNLRLYEKLYPILKRDGRFLFNYGSYLSDYGYYQKSLSVLTEAERYISGSGLCIYLADDYLELGNIKKAEEYYLEAINTVPAFMYPRYKLIEFYLRLRKYKEAKAQCMTALSKKPKQMTPNAQLILTAINQILYVDLKSQ